MEALLHKTSDQSGLAAFLIQTYVRNMGEGLDKLFKVHDCLSAVLFKDDIDLSIGYLLKTFSSVFHGRGGFIYKFKEHRRLDARLVQCISALAVVIEEST